MAHQVKEHQSAEFSMTSWKDMKIVIHAGNLEGWGRVLKLPVNKYRFGLRFHSHQLTQKKVATSAVKGHIPSLPDTFTSVGHLRDDSVYVMGEENNMTDGACFVYQKV